MPEIFENSWSLEVLGYLIFSGVFLGKNILSTFYIPQFGKFPEYAWCCDKIIMKSLLLLSYTKKKKHWRWSHHDVYIMCHTYGITNQYGSTSPKGPKWDTDMKTNEHLWASVPATGQKKHAHQWWLMGARVKIVWKNKTCKMFNILHRRPGPHGTSNQTSLLWEQIQTSVREAYDTLRNKHAHTSHKGGFTLPCIPFHLFHFCDMLTRALYNKCRYRYR